MGQKPSTHTVTFGNGNNNITYGHGSANCGNTDNSHHNTYNNYKSDEDANIMSWLSPLEPGNIHDGVRTKRFEGAGNWLLETNEFREWRSLVREPYKAALFCSGSPGAGKTYLR